MDLDMDDITSQQASIAQKLEQREVGLCVAVEVEREQYLTGILIDKEKVSMDCKGKGKIVHDKTWPDEAKDASASEPGNSTSVEGSSDGADNLKNPIPDNLNGPNSDQSNSHEDEEMDDADYVSDYDDNDDFIYEDDYVDLQAQFDNVDLPPGVEALLPWLKEPASGANMSAVAGPSAVPVLDLSQIKAFSGSSSALPDPVHSQTEALAGSSSMVPGESSSEVKREENGEGPVMTQSLIFKQFDTVEDYSDHHYSRMGFSDAQPPKNWTKRIQEEWRSLEKNLPETIYVRVYEARMELLRAIIVGPDGTPYHDGLFVFDCLFPTDYPNSPPMVYYYSGGLRLNPNLYDCGKVCLSLLGTWTGDHTEMWNPEQSTMLQVLVSIQALILNARPFFNEPGFERYIGPEGERQSNKYNEDAFILSLKTMMYTLRRPPKHFEDFVAEHFRNRACRILLACKAYVEGARVGSVINGRVEDDSTGMKSSSGFKATLGGMMRLLIMNFTKNGSKDCEQFRSPA